MARTLGSLIAQIHIEKSSVGVGIIETSLKTANIAGKIKDVGFKTEYIPKIVNGEQTISGKQVGSNTVK